MVGKNSEETDDQSQVINSVKPDTTRISTGSIFVVVAEALGPVIFDLCTKLTIEFKTVVTHTIEEVRAMIGELFQEEDISHYHHLNNVEILIEAVLEHSSFRSYLEEIKVGKYRDNIHKRNEIDQLLSPLFAKIMKLAMGMHDIGKLFEEVQKVINIKGKAPTKEQETMMQRHTASEALFEELGITRDNFPIILLIALFHHFSEYAGADPRQEELFHIPDQSMELEKTKLYEFIPIIATLGKVIDIIEAMTSQIRTYRDRCVIRWFNEDKGKDFVRGDGKLHTSIEGELRKKCGEDEDFAILVLNVVHSLWGEKEGIPGLSQRMIRTRDQLSEKDNAKLDALIERYNPKQEEAGQPYQSGRLPRVA
jgi:CRISPR/Cas system-associated endonuclease Cas3-HD